MVVKKYKKLQQYANESLSSLRDDGFLQEIKVKSNVQNKKLSQKSIFIISASICTLVLIVVLCVVLINPASTGEGQNHNEHKYYLLENQATMSSTIDEFNIFVKDFSVKDQTGILINKVVDKYYEELLYFVVIINNDETMESVSLFVVVNDEYTLPFAVVGEINNDFVEGYRISYSESFTEEDELFYVYSVGEIFTEHEKVFVEYNGVDIEKKNNFLVYLSQVIQ